MIRVEEEGGGGEHERENRITSGQVEGKKERGKSIYREGRTNPSSYARRV